MRIHRFLFLLPLLLPGIFACSRLPGMKRTYRPAEENLAAREWFADARFGLFVQWGPQQDGSFSPERFDPEQWVGLAKFSGARYLTFTAKNADGFAMFDSAHSDFDVMDASTFKRDVVAELARECDRQGLRLFLNYSQPDHHHPDYAGSGLISTPGRWSRYLEFQDRQIRELIESHKDVAGIRLEGLHHKPEADWRLRRTYDMIHAIGEECLVGNNHKSAPRDGEDYIIFDQTPPGASGYADMPLEFAEPMGDRWGWSAEVAKELKSTRDLLHHMIRAAGSNANYLLGVAPDPDGVIPQGQVQRLREMGNWLEIYGPSVFGTRGGPLPPAEWGVTTNQDRKIYIHYLAEKGGSLRFTNRIGEIDIAYQFSTGLSMDFTKDGEEYVFEIPERMLDPVDTIIVLEMEQTGKN